MRKVLLITDTQLVAMAIEMVLEPQANGIELVWRVSTPQGLAECVNGPPLDMIVIDLDTHGARRLGLAKRVIGLQRRARVVTLTGSPSDEEAAQAEALDVDAYLRKDMPNAELAAALRGYLKPPSEDA